MIFHRIRLLLLADENDIKGKSFASFGLAIDQNIIDRQLWSSVKRDLVLSAVILSYSNQSEFSTGFHAPIGPLCITLDGRMCID